MFFNYAPGPAEGRAPLSAVNSKFWKRYRIGKISNHYGMGHGSVPCRSLLVDIWSDKSLI